ncbi:phosphatidylinositol glycan anchor biosynthesis class G [Musca autumnalis]|uniref:phosphatidylinositol glycan anchor biosynthesis class G n=1 Tax=Musca autumnalis TaxID=221902 RepID=UPI003CF47D32
MDHPFNYLFHILTIFVGGSLLFLVGFFPVSRNLTVGNNYGNSSTLSLLDKKLPEPSPKHDQVILMLIDAWRWDFANSTNMPYSYGNACNHVNIKVNVPTVTMPRLKSITTGTVSNFIDIVLNLGHTEKLADSLLHRVRDKGKQIVFSGDRTWVQLFPDLFLRQKPNMDSFFVNDFYEGDKNITANVREELPLKDWQLMILHYLGLDHIGHVEGSHSYKIFEKLHEMDDVIKYITTSQEFQNKVLLVTGDHGMRNGGSHGGSDKEELYVPLMLFSDKCTKRNRTVDYNQIDMTPTLAVLLGVDIPFSSVGCLISDFIDDFPKEEQLYYYYYNALHLMEKFRRKYTLSQIKAQGFSDYYFWLTEAEMEHKLFLESNLTSFLAYDKAKKNYIRLSENISKILSDSSVKYDNDLIFISLVLTTTTAIHLLTKVLFGTKDNFKKWQQFSSGRLFLSIVAALALNCIAHFFEFIYSRHFIYSAVLTVPIAISIYLAIEIFLLVVQILIPMSYDRKCYFRLTIPWMLFAFFIFHTFSLASSSLIEEEHQTWYYLTPTILIYLAAQNVYYSMRKMWKLENNVGGNLISQLWQIRHVILAMLAIVLCRRLNQTGDKWRHLEDIGDVLSREQNHYYLLLTFATALIFLLWSLRKQNTPLQMVTCCTALFSVFLYREWSQSNPLVLSVFWISVVGTAFIRYRIVFCKPKHYGYGVKSNLVELLGSNLTISLLISALLHKPHNVILLPAMLLCLESSYYLCDNLHLYNKKLYNRCYILVYKAVITIFLGNMFYFFQGNSNSLSTIDINPGYIGLSSFNPIIVGAMITFNTYCAPINAFLYLMWHMFVTQKSSLPLRQEKEQVSNAQLLESTEEDLYLVISLFTATTVMPVAVYWLLLMGFRYHLFIYSVFAPKAFYECFHILVFYLNFIVTNLYFRLFQ